MSGLRQTDPQLPVRPTDFADLDPVLPGSVPAAQLIDDILDNLDELLSRNAGQMPAIAEILGGALADPDERVRRKAAVALGQIGLASLPALRPLVAALGDGDERLRELVGIAVARIGRPAVGALLAAMDGPDVQAWAAAAALARTGAPEAIPELIRVLTTSGRPPWFAGSALCAIGPEALPALLSAFADAGPAGRMGVLYVLGNLRPIGVAAQSCLLRGLMDDDDRVRLMACQMLENHCTPVHGAVARAMQPADSHFRRAAAESVGTGELTPQRFAGVLRAIAASDRSATVRSLARRALAHL